MTEPERIAAEALGACIFIPGSPPKRFARQIAADAKSANPQITERQAEWLRVLVHRYRRQIPAEVVALAADPHIGS